MGEADSRMMAKDSSQRKLEWGLEVEAAAGCDVEAGFVESMLPNPGSDNSLYTKHFGLSAREATPTLTGVPVQSGLPSIAASRYCVIGFNSNHVKDLSIQRDHVLVPQQSVPPSFRRLVYVSSTSIPNLFLPFAPTALYTKLLGLVRFYCVGKFRWRPLFGSLALTRSAFIIKACLSRRVKQSGNIDWRFVIPVLTLPHFIPKLVVQGILTSRYPSQHS